MVEESDPRLQRVALARSLTTEPGVLLLDEPLSNLDAKLRASLRFELKEIQRETGVTAVYLTHDQAEAVVLGDRIAVMNNGRIVQLAAPFLPLQPSRQPARGGVHGRHQLPAEPFRAPGRRRGRLRLGGGVEVRGASSGTTAPGSEVELSVRPENLSLEPAGTPVAGRPNVWMGKVIQADFLGTPTIYHVAVAGEQLTVVENGSWLKHQAGASINLHAPPERVSLLQGG